MALSLAQVGHGALAWEVARDIEDARQRSAALRAVALSLAQVGHGALAWEVARDIEDARQRGEALAAGALSLAQAGRERSKQGVH